LSFESTGYGYGPASLSHLLRVDPTQYPNTNPLLDKPGGLGVPTAQDFAAAATKAATPTPSASASAAAAGTPSGQAAGSVLPGLLTGVVVVVLLLLVLAGLAVVLMRSLRRKAAPSTPTSVRPDGAAPEAGIADGARPNGVGSVAVDDETVPATTPQRLGPPT
jgi:membrane protein implicated in regulation of membrane protease activity